MNLGFLFINRLVFGLVFVKDKFVFVGYIFDEGYINMYMGMKDFLSNINIIWD